VNRVGHAARLANAHADPSAVVPHHCDDTEGKATTALHNIGDPRYVYDVLV
jgi:hypothetical protein